MNEILPEPTPVVSANKYTWQIWLKFFLLSVCAISLLAISVYVWMVNVYPSISNSSNTLGNEENPAPLQTPLNQFYSNKTNLSFVIPTGWREVDPTTITSPIGISNPQFMFLQAELGCIIAAGTFDRTAADYKQTSFGNRVISPGFQFDGNWYTNQAYHKEPIVFSEDTRQYRAYEFREAYNLDTVDIILWQKDNTAVPDECSRDLDSLLQTVQHHFSPITLQDYFDGTLFFRTINPGTDKVETRLLYTDNDNKNTYVVVTLPPYTGHGGNVFVRNGALYALAELDEVEGQSAKSVIKIDPVQATLEELPLVSVNDKVITQYTTSDSIYFMVASSSALCTGYRESCQADLYVYDFNSGERKLLRSNIKSARLDGFDAVTGTLYLNRTWGDAGCYASNIDSYHINTNTVLNDSFSACEGDPGYDTYESTLEKFYGKDNKNWDKAIHFKEGSFTSSDIDTIGINAMIHFVK